MGRAIVRNPVAFLMDEPLSNLDAKLRGQMRAEIRSLQRQLRDHHALRHPRPGRGHDDGRPDRRPPQGPAAAARYAGRAVPLAGQPLRRRVHRLPADERPQRRRERARRTGTSWSLGSQRLQMRRRARSTAYPSLRRQRRHAARCRPPPGEPRGRPPTADPAGRGWSPTSSWWRTCRRRSWSTCASTPTRSSPTPRSRSPQDIDAAAAEDLPPAGHRLGRARPAPRSRGRARRRPGRVRRRAVRPALLRPVHRPGDPARPRRARRDRPWNDEDEDRMSTPPHTVKRGVSLYSFQEEYFLRTMSLEDCIAAAGAHRRARDRDHPRAVDPGLPAPDRRVRRHLVRLDGEVRDDAGRHRPLPRHQAVPGPLADPRGAGRLVPPRHRHRGAARREGRPRDHQHPAGGHGGRRAVRRGRRASGCCWRCTRPSTTSTRGSCSTSRSCTGPVRRRWA